MRAWDTRVQPHQRTRPLKVASACIIPTTCSGFSFWVGNCVAIAVTSFSRIMTRRRVISELGMLDGASALHLLSVETFVSYRETRACRLVCWKAVHSDGQNKLNNWIKLLRVIYCSKYIKKIEIILRINYNS